MKEYQWLIPWTVREQGTNKVLGTVNARSDLLAEVRAKAEYNRQDITVDDIQYLDNLSRGDVI